MFYTHTLYNFVFSIPIDFISTNKFLKKYIKFMLENTNSNLTDNLTFCKHAIKSYIFISLPLLKKLSILCNHSQFNTI